VRLFRQKGKLKVEMGVLSKGDILGESLLLDGLKTESAIGYSAEAMTEVETVKIVAKDFSAQLEKLNPLINLVVKGVVGKLKKAYQRIKELDAQSALSDQKEYLYLKDHEIGKMLSLIYFFAHTFGQKNGTQFDFNKRLINSYLVDVFGLSEAKALSLLVVLQEHNIVKMLSLQDGSSLVSLLRTDFLKTLVNFYQAERFLLDDKKMKVSLECFKLIEKINAKIQTGDFKEKDSTTVHVEMSDIFSYYKERNQQVDKEDLADAQRAKLLGELLVSSATSTMIEVYLERFHKYFPILTIQRSLKKLNDEKSS
jgi:CRP-like cAMP-binding protein